MQSDKDKIKELERRIDELERNQRQRVPYLPPEPYRPDQLWRYEPPLRPWELPPHNYGAPYVIWC